MAPGLPESRPENCPSAASPFPHPDLGTHLPRPLRRMPSPSLQIRRRVCAPTEGQGLARRSAPATVTLGRIRSEREGFRRILWRRGVGLRRCTAADAQQTSFIFSLERLQAGLSKGLPEKHLIHSNGEDVLALGWILWLHESVHPSHSQHSTKRGGDWCSMLRVGLSTHRISHDH